MPTEYAPLAQVWTQLNSQAYFDLQPTELLDFTEDFSSDTGQMSFTPSGTAPSHTIGGGVLNVTTSSSGDNGLTSTENSSSYSMPQLFVSVTVDVVAGPYYSVAGVGIAKDANNVLFAVAVPGSNQVSGFATIAGTYYGFAYESVSLPSSFEIGMSLVGNSVVVWINTGSGWTVVQNVNASSFGYNFQTVGNLTGWQASTYVYSAGVAANYNFSNLQSGRFGGVGVRDNILVVNEDGSPYNPSGNVVMFGGTTTDPTGQGYQGLFKYDLIAETVTQVGAIMNERSGEIYPDINAAIVVLESGDIELLMATWGNGFGGAINIVAAELSGLGLLSGTQVVSGLTALALPGLLTGSYGSYDPFLVYDVGASLWRIAYSITSDTTFPGSYPFYPAMATSPDLTTWTLVGADTTRQGYEGTSMYQVNGEWYLMAGGPTNAAPEANVYDDTMTYLGQLDINLGSATLLAPHPMAFPFGDSFYMITFDASEYGGQLFTRGNVVLQSAPRYSAFPVPNVVGLSESAAVTAIEAAPLTVGTVTEVSSGAPVNQVVSQSPAAGTDVAEGSAVSLDISAGVTLITVPNLVGLTQVAATALIVSLGLTLGAVTTTDGPPPLGLVLAQGPVAGTEVIAGSTITLQLSGGNVIPIVPAMTNQALVEATTISQYANSPTLDQLCTNMSTYLDPRADLLNFYNYVWNVGSAQGFGLNIWGRIVGVSRVIPIPGSTDSFGFYNSDVPADWENFGGAPFFGGEVDTGGFSLNDSSYRTLILTKALANIVATNAPSLNQLISNLFPGRGQCYTLDGGKINASAGGMSMTYVFEFSLSTVEYAILAYSGVLPHPAGVLVNITVIPSGGFFGFNEAGANARPLSQGIFNS